MRCLVWRGEEEVLVGCLDGLVHWWKVGAESRVLFAMEGSIIHMRWNHTNKVVYHSIAQYIIVTYIYSTTTLTLLHCCNFNIH